jgi:hypothetical protein
MKVRCTNCSKVIVVPKSTFKDAAVATNIKCTGCCTYFKPEFPAATKKPVGTPTVQIHGVHALSKAIGWLVVHDEKTSTQTFDLHLGKQVIGRKSESVPCDIMIDCNDQFMSRSHFAINIVQNSRGLMVYELTDFKSKNRTLINEKELSLTDTYLLQDNDTIQAGETKLIFKNNDAVKNSNEATELVKSKPYSKTILAN